MSMGDSEECKELVLASGFLTCKLGGSGKMRRGQECGRTESGVESWLPIKHQS